MCTVSTLLSFPRRPLLIKLRVVKMSAVVASDVIDWDEAMEQCGDDEDFLRELLADLRGETDTQVAKIEETIRVSQE